MKTKIKRIIKIGVIITALLTVTTGPVSACTGFTASDDDERVLAGTNFDLSFNFDVYMHFFPAEEEKYGRVIYEIPWPITENDPPYFRDPDWVCPKHGMNDQGLYSDIFITPDLVPVNSSDKPYFFSEDPDYYGWAYWTYCLANCATVSEVLDIFNQYNLRVQVFWQCFFADRNGDSVIIEGDDIIFREGDFQVVTNFLHSRWNPPYPCRRYNTAVEMLGDMPELTVDYFSSICDATTQSTTIFSTVYDLRQQKFHVHYNMDFDKALEFDLNEELAQGERRIQLGPLFEPDDNQPPEKPEAPNGPESGNVSTEYRYSCKKTNDPDGDRTMYLFDWGDGTQSHWIHPTYFGSIKATHNMLIAGRLDWRPSAKRIPRGSEATMPVTPMTSVSVKPPQLVVCTPARPNPPESSQAAMKG